VEKRKEHRHGFHGAAGAATKVDQGPKGRQAGNEIGRAMSAEGASLSRLCRPFGPHFSMCPHPELTLGAIHFRRFAPHIPKNILPKKQETRWLLHRLKSFLHD
jgi:hypothetical protein